MHIPNFILLSVPDENNMREYGANVFEYDLYQKYNGRWPVDIVSWDEAKLIQSMINPSEGNLAIDVPHIVGYITEVRDLKTKEPFTMELTKYGQLLYARKIMPPELWIKHFEIPKKGIVMKIYTRAIQNTSLEHYDEVFKAIHKHHYT